MVFSFLRLSCACPSAPTPHTPPSPWPGQADTRLASFPRIGLSQLEGFRRQLLDVLQRSTKPKVSPSPPPTWACWALGTCLTLGTKHQRAQPCEARPVAAGVMGTLGHQTLSTSTLISSPPWPVLVQRGKLRPRVGKGLVFAHASCQDWDQGLLSSGPVSQSCLKSGKSRPEVRCFKFVTGRPLPSLLRFPRLHESRCHHRRASGCSLF